MTALLATSSRLRRLLSLGGLALVVAGVVGLVTEPNGFNINFTTCPGPICPARIAGVYPSMSGSLGIAIALAAILPLLAFRWPRVWWLGLACAIAGPIVFGGVYLSLSGNAPTPSDVAIAELSSILLVVGGALVGTSMVLIRLNRRSSVAQRLNRPSVPS